MIQRIGALAVCAFALAGPALSQDEDFPSAPETLKAAEAAGLPRLGVEALRQAFVGRRTERTPRGEFVQADYGPDGRIEQRIGGSVFDTGTFSITGMAGGSVCLLLIKQMNQRLCGVWFAAPDGRHLFGYNPTDGKPRGVSRAADGR